MVVVHILFREPIRQEVRQADRGGGRSREDYLRWYSLAGESERGMSLPASRGRHIEVTSLRMVFTGIQLHAPSRA
jgi:hypothetical protein